MKIEKIKVSRNVEVAGQADVERSTTVAFRAAENAQEMLEICGGSLESVLKNFNEGRWANLRTQTSNALAGRSPEQKAVDNIVKAFKVMNPGLSDEQIRVMVLAMPNMEAATKVGTDILPAEIPDTFFEEKKAAKKAEKESEPEAVSA